MGLDFDLSKFFDRFEGRGAIPLTAFIFGVPVYLAAHFRYQLDQIDSGILGAFAFALIALLCIGLSELRKNRKKYRRFKNLSHGEVGELYEMLQFGGYSQHSTTLSYLVHLYDKGLIQKSVVPEEKFFRFGITDTALRWMRNDERFKAYFPPQKPFLQKFRN